MNKYINIIVLYQIQFHKGSKINILYTNILWIYTDFEMRLPGLKGQGQGQGQKKIEVKKCLSGI